MTQATVLIVPGLRDRPAGCLFAPRCAHVQPRCVHERPALQGGGASGTAAVRCFFPLAAPAVAHG